VHHDESISKICIIFGGALGDLVLLLPSLVSLREVYSSAQIAILGNPLWLEFLAERGYVDKTYSLEQMPVYLLFQSNLAQTHPFIEFLKDFDIILSWFGDRQGILERNLRSLATTPLVFVFPFKNHEQNTGHVSEFYLSTLRHLGITVAAPRFKILPAHSSSSSKGCSQMADYGLEPPRLCIHPGSGAKAKIWPLKNFIDVALEVTRRLAVQVSFVLGPAEEEYFQTLKESARIQSTAILRDLSVSGLATLLEHSRLYLGNDSGPTHLAACTGVCTVAIFGPTSVEKWAPRGPDVHIIRKETPCCPCNIDVMHQCTTRHCLAEITPEEVVEVLCSLMKSENR